MTDIEFVPRDEGYFTSKGKLIVDELADDLADGLDLAVAYRQDGDPRTGVLYVWDGAATVWRPADPLIIYRLRRALGSRWTSHHEKEALLYMLGRPRALVPSFEGYVAFANVVVADNDPADWTPRLQQESYEDQLAPNYFYTGDWTAVIPHILILPGLYGSPEDPAAFEQWVAARTPVTSKFLGDVLWPDAQDFAWEMIGYFLTSRRIGRQALLLRGAGANGKSRFLQLLINLLGEHNVSHLPLQAINKSSNPELEQLRDKLANIVDDMGAKAGADTSNFKTAVTGGKLTVNPKYRTPYSFESRAKFAFAVNHIPVSNDTSAGWTSRWLVVPFETTIPVDRRIDAAKLDAMLIAEAPYIVTRAMRALHRLIRRGHFDVPPSFDAASVEFEEASNPVLAWVNDGGCTIDPGATIKGMELLSDFKHSPHGEPFKFNMPARQFYEMLRSVPGVETYTGHGKQVRVKGLRRTEPLQLPARSTSGDVEGEA